MNSDIRISTTFFFHRKTKKLLGSLKEHGVLCLLRLWARVAVEKPCGVLSGWDVEDIELEADFRGECGVFVSELLRLGFLDEKDGVYALHNWHKRQTWVSGSEERGDKARFSRMAKTQKDLYEKMVNDGRKSISRDEYEALVSKQRNVDESLTKRKRGVKQAVTPSPSPSPSPRKSKDTPACARARNSSGKAKPQAALPKNKISRSPRYNEIIPEPTLGAIVAACQEIDKLHILKPKPKVRRFEPHKWVQKVTNHQANFQAIEMTLKRLVQYWDTTKNPNGYIEKIFKIENQNLNERSGIAEHQAHKNAPVPEKFKTLTKEIGGD